MPTGAQLHAFYRGVAVHERVWFIELQSGAPATWRYPNDLVVMPVWSTESRVKRILKFAPGLVGASPQSLTLGAFVEAWRSKWQTTVGGLGVNWEGPKVSGPELPAKVVFEQVSAAMVNRKRVGA